MKQWAVAITFALSLMAPALQATAVENKHCQMLHMSNCACVEQALVVALGPKQAAFMINYWLRENEPSGADHFAYLVANYNQINNTVMAFSRVKNQVGLRCRAIGNMFDNDY